MSGGHFDYNQYRIREIADSVEQLIEKNGKKKDYKIESWEDEYYYEYPPEVIDKFKEGLDILRKAEIYTQRIDWLVSGDDGEESFLRRLKEDLNNNSTKTMEFTKSEIEKQKLEFAIEQLEYVKKMYPDKDSEECVNVRLKELKQQLSEI